MFFTTTYLVDGGDADGFSSAVVPEENRLNMLLREVGKQSQSAFEALYQSLAPKVVGYLRIRLKNDSEIEEVLQDTFLAVWRQARDFQQQSTVLTWIIGIARHKLQDKWRVQQREASRTASLSELNEQPTSDFALNVLERLSLNEAISQLPTASQELLYLVFVQKLSYPEVALLLDIPPGTVKSRVFQLRSRLRTLYTEEAITNG